MADDPTATAGSAGQDRIPTTAAGPWCPVCREQVAARGVYQPPNGFYEVFADHGCDGDGRKVQDADHGFVVDGKVVPSWEM